MDIDMQEEKLKRLGEGRIDEILQANPCTV